MIIQKTDEKRHSKYELIQSTHFWYGYKCILRNQIVG